jgi:hypothetical protein
MDESRDSFGKLPKLAGSQPVLPGKFASPRRSILGSGATCRAETIVAHKVRFGGTPNQHAGRVRHPELDCFANQRPQFRIELGLRALRNRIAIRVRTQNRKNCRT